MVQGYVARTLYYEKPKMKRSLFPKIGFKNLSGDFRKIVNNLAWLLGDRIFRMSLSLVVGVWVARYLGPQDFGLYNYAIAIIGMFGSFANLGLNNLVIRDLAGISSAADGTPHSISTGKNRLLGTTSSLRLMGGVIASLLSLITVTVLKPEDLVLRRLVLILSIGTLFESFYVIDLWFRSQTLSKFTVIVRNSSYLVATILKVTMISINASVIAFAGVRLSEILLTVAGFLLIYKFQGKSSVLNWKPSYSQGKKLLLESWPIFLQGLTIFFYTQLDQLMLGSMFDDASELGIYSAAVRVSEVFNFVPIIVASSILPKLTDLRAKDAKKYDEKFQAYFDLMMYLWILIAIPISLLSPLIIKLLFGQAFAASALVLSIYVWAQFGTNFGTARSTYLTIEGGKKLRLSLYASVIGVALNFILNFLLIPRYGAVGATIATLFTYFAVTILTNFIFKELEYVGQKILKSCNLYKAAFRIYGLLK